MASRARWVEIRIPHGTDFSQPFEIHTFLPEGAILSDPVPTPDGWIRFLIKRRKGRSSGSKSEETFIPCLVSHLIRVTFEEKNGGEGKLIGQIGHLLIIHLSPLGYR